MPTSNIATLTAMASLYINGQAGAGRVNMTPRQLAVIERVRHTPARFVQIPPKRGVRVGDAMCKLREEDARRMSAVLALRLCRSPENIASWWWWRARCFRELGSGKKPI